MLLEIDGNLLNSLYGATTGGEVCGFFKEVNDLKQAKECLEVTQWKSDNVEVIRAGKSKLVALCRLSPEIINSFSTKDAGIVAKLFPDKGVKVSKTEAKVVDEYDSYEGLVKVAGWWDIDLVFRFALWSF